MKVFASQTLRVLLLLQLWVGLALGAWAQDTAPGDFRFEHLTVDQGLSHSDAMCVAQDRAGFIWVGTNRGLDRYDGYNLKQYTLPTTTKGISGNRIRALHVAPGGRLWVGSEGTGVSYYDATADRLVRLSAPAAPAASQALLRQLMDGTIMALTSDGQGRLWVGTQMAGLFVLAFNAQGQLASLRRVPLAAHPTAEYYVSCLAPDEQGNLWVGTFDQGLSVVRAGSPATATLEPTDLTGPVRALHVDRRGDLWAGGNSQVWWASAADRRAVRGLAAHPQATQYPQTQSLLLDSFGRLWVGTIYGLYVWEAGAVTGSAPPLRATPTQLLPVDGEPFALNSERIHQVFEDRTHVLWLCASAGGLNRVDLLQKPFGQLRRQRTGQESMANNYINAVCKEDDTNTLWLGTRNGALAYDLATHTYQSYLNRTSAGTLRGVDVSAIFRARSGTLWFGTRIHGLVSMTRQGGQKKFVTHDYLPNGQRLAATSIERLTEDRQGNLWLATYGEGLYKLSPTGEFLAHYYKGNGSLPSNILSYVLYDERRDVLWASTVDQGLLKLRITPDTLRVQQQLRYQPGAADGLQVDYVWPLLLDRQGTLWIGTIGGGLHRLDTDASGHDAVRSLRKYLPESDVESLLADETGEIWIGGTGLYRYSPATRQYVRYDVADGLQSNAFKIGAAARGADGTLYFGGINGVSYFQPALIQPNRRAPAVLITGLRIANQPVAVGQPFNGRVLLTQPLTEPQTVVIRPGDNDFAVEFVGLNYANPQKNRYAYQLEGYNAGWVLPPPGQRLASFANLPPGHYTLRVKASNGEGGWSPRPAVLHFDVRAPWYKTIWAYALYALVALGGVALYRRVEMSQQELRSRLVLKQFQAEKEKELTSLKLGFFTNISHELRTPLTLILGPMEEIVAGLDAKAGLRAKGQLVQRQAQKLLELVNQLLDFRKVETGHMALRASYGDVGAFIADDIYPTFSLRAQERGVTYSLALPSPPVQLYFDRSKLDIILVNLLANAFKYTRPNGLVQLAATAVGNPAGEAVYAHGRLTDNYLKVTVADNGVGIKYYELERIFDPYYQASHTNTLRMTGTGIGLALARQFAERHGGTLTAGSGEGLGTTFELRLPFGRQHLRPEDVQPDEPTPDALPGAAVQALAESEQFEQQVVEYEMLALEAGPAPARLPRLLVVEDHDEVRQYIEQLFAADYEVLTAEDGLDGWNQALAQLPDLVISDVMMPRSDGLELCRKIKQHPKTAHIPVLLLTARTAETHELEGLGMGADDYVSKPFTASVLLARVAAQLRNRRKLHEFYQRHILLQPTEIVVADADREFLEAAMRVVEQHLSDPDFNVQALVSAMAMSSSVFYRRIKSITGQTVVEFIRDVRLKRAAQLLAQTQMRVSEVAFEVGIENAKYFRQVFQKLYGTTPSDYARQHRDVAAQAE